MTNRCVRCWNTFEASYKGNVCGGCSTVTPGLPTFKPGINSGRLLMKGTKDESWISRAEEGEINRGVAIPIGNGRFAQGRRMENGKIAEKHIGN